MPRLKQKQFDAQAELDVQAQKAAQRERDEQSYLEWRALCERRAWGTEVQVTHLEAFIREKDLMPEFVDYVRIAAAVDESAMDGGQPKLVERPRH